MPGNNQFKNLTFSYFLIFSLNLLFVCGIYAQSGSISFIEFFSGTDTNVLRDTTGRSADNTYQVFFHRRSSFNTAFKIYGAYSLSGGMSLYTRFSSENRASFNSAVNLRLPVTRISVINFDGTAKFKYYFNGINYQLFNSHQGIILTPKPGFVLQFYADLIKFNMPDDPDFSYTCAGAGGSFTYKFSGSLSLSVRSFAAKRVFLRDAFDYTKNPDTSDNWIRKSFRQNDNIYSVSLNLQAFSVVFIDADISFDTNLSNSFGYSYRRPKFSFTIARAITENITLTIKGAVQKKAYKEKVAPILMVRPKTEFEENSFIIGDLARDFGDKNSIKIRFAFYKNESPFRERFYKKSVITVGYSHRF